MKSFFILSVAAVPLSSFALSPLAEKSVVASSDEYPNIIVIFADDLGIGDISGFNPDSKIRTRNIDKLCENGIRFTDAHSTSSVSTPSRYSLLTGRYAFRTPLKTGTLAGFSEPLIDENRTTMASMLKTAGYETACMGKWHLGWDWAKDENGEVDYSKPVGNPPTTRGFDYFYGISASLDMSPYVYVENDMPTALPNRLSVPGHGILLQRQGPMGADFQTEDVLPNLWRKSVEFIENHKDSEKPFFLYLPLTAPHTPILPTKEYQGKSGLSPYGDFVLMIDDMVGDIIKTLEETGLYDNTIVIFSSDNGCAIYADMEGMEAQGHYPSYIYRGSKSDLYEGGHRIPLVVSWGKKYKSQTETGLVSLADFFATFAEMTGYEMKDSEGEDSWSIWPVLNGSGTTSRPDVIHHSIDGYFSLRSGKWKILFTPGSGGWSEPTPNSKGYDNLPAIQLYDIETDPAETTNLQDKFPEVVAELTLKMKNYLENGRSTPGEPQSNDPISHQWKQIAPFTE